MPVVSESEAVRILDRSRYTLRRWRQAGFVDARKVNGEWHFDLDSLLATKKYMADRYENRRARPGPGRGRASVTNTMPLWTVEELQGNET